MVIIYCIALLSWQLVSTYLSGGVTPSQAKCTIEQSQFVLCGSVFSTSKRGVNVSVAGSLSLQFLLRS